jgi:hypothetical protein
VQDPRDTANSTATSVSKRFADSTENGRSIGRAGELGRGLV